MNAGRVTHAFVVGGDSSKALGGVGGHMRVVIGPVGLGRLLEAGGADVTDAGGTGGKGEDGQIFLGSRRQVGPTIDGDLLAAGHLGPVVEGDFGDAGRD